MKKYNQIYLNGCSYTAINTLHKVYGNFLSDELGIPVTNAAVRGSCNARIFRRTIDDLITKNKDTLVIIGLSFVNRDELWYEDNQIEILSRIPDTDKWKDSKLITANYVLSSLDAISTRDRMIDLNVNRQLAHFYTNLFMFTNTLENLGFDYFIFSAAENSDWREANFDFFNSWQITKQCLDNPKIYNLHTFSLKKFAIDNDLACTDTWHLYEDGHKCFSEFLLNKIKNLYNENFML